MTTVVKLRPSLVVDVNGVGTPDGVVRDSKKAADAVGLSSVEYDRFATLLGAQLKHGNHPILEMCAKNATVITDPAGNRKFVKGKSSGRIDGMVALAMSVGAQNSDEVEEQGDVNDFIYNFLSV